MKKSMGIMAGLLGGLGIGGIALAAPPVAKAPTPAAVAKTPPGKLGGNPRGDAPDWITIKTLSFEHMLPKNWLLLEKKRQDFSLPSTGQWRYASPNAHGKIFIRISRIRPGGMKEAWKRALTHMNRKVNDLLQVSMIDLPAGPTGGEAQLGFFAGVMPAYSTTNKAVHYYHHSIVRYLKQSLTNDLQVSITYFFAPRRAETEQVQAFVQKHLATFALYDPIEVGKLIASEAAKDKRPVKNPLPATKEALKQLQKKTELATEAGRKTK